MDKDKVNHDIPSITSPSINGTAHNELDLHLYHLLAADFFLRQSCKIEEKYLENPVSVEKKEKTKHKAFIVNGIISTVASLEATINSFWLAVRKRTRKTRIKNLRSI